MPTFKLSAKQEEQRNLAASPATHILAFGGSRSGKTFGFTRCTVARALMAPRSRHLIARLHNIDVRQAVMMDTFPTVMREAYPEVEFELNRSDQYVTFANESEVWFGGLDDKERVDKILGKEFATIYPNECSQIAYETILTLRTRMAQKVFKVDGRRLALKAYYDLNPVGRSHWSYREFVEGVSPVDRSTKFREGSRAFIQMNPMDNPHLPEGYLEELQAMPERQRRRFLDGAYQLEVEGALWTTELLDSLRVDPTDLPEMERVVVAVDPSGTKGSADDGDAVGIVVAGRGVDGIAYLLADRTLKASPARWAATISSAYDTWNADRVVAENNYGGAMVEQVVRTAAPDISYKTVTATRGKVVRAEPIAALYEQQKVRHVGTFGDLEDELCQFTTAGYSGSSSPNRADALVWALTDLMLTKHSNFEWSIH